MDWILFWTAFGAIGGTVGALATAAAVLWRYGKPNIRKRKKLKLMFSDDVRIATGLGENVGELVSLDVTNIGNRMTVLIRWGFELKNNEKMIIVSNLPMDSLPVLLQKQFISKFPYNLDIEQQVTLYYEKRKFLKVISDSCQKNELEPNQKRKQKNTVIQLEVETQTLQQEIEVQERQHENIELFIQKADKYVGIERLTPYALRELIQGIYVEAPDKSTGNRRQTIHIKYDGIGFIPLDVLMNGKTA